VPDVSLVNPAITTAPKDYVVPGAQEFRLDAVRAVIDGSAAAGQFVPALQMLDRTGNVMWTATQTTAVSAGVSLDVSWFPGVNTAASQSIASGAWTQVFHFDVPALGAPTSIDTLGTTWSTANNNIFGVFMGKSVNGAHNDQLNVQVNGDTLGHYGWAYEYGNKYIVGQAPAAVWNTAGNVLDLNGSLGLCGAAGDSLGDTAFFITIPKIYQSNQTGKIISYGGYAGLVSGVQGTAVTSYEFSTITRLNIFYASGSAFSAGSSLTLWAV